MNIIKIYIFGYTDCILNPLRHRSGKNILHFVSSIMGRHLLSAAMFLDFMKSRKSVNKFTKEYIKTNISRIDGDKISTLHIISETS